MTDATLIQSADVTAYARLQQNWWARWGGDVRNQLDDAMPWDWKEIIDGAVDRCEAWIAGELRWRVELLGGGQ